MKTCAHRDITRFLISNSHLKPSSMVKCLLDIQIKIYSIQNKVFRTCLVRVQDVDPKGTSAYWDGCPN